MKIDWDYDKQSYIIKHGGNTEIEIKNEFLQDNGEIEVFGIIIKQKRETSDANLRINKSK